MTDWQPISIAPKDGTFIIIAIKPLPTHKHGARLVREARFINGYWKTIAPGGPEYVDNHLLAWAPMPDHPDPRIMQTIASEHSQKTCPRFPLPRASSLLCGFRPDPALPASMCPTYRPSFTLQYLFRLPP